MLNPAGCVKLKSKSGRFPHPSIYVPECLDCVCVLSSTMPQPLKFYCAADHCGKRPFCVRCGFLVGASIRDWLPTVRALTGLAWTRPHCAAA